MKARKPETVAEYISEFQEDIQRILEQVRKAIKQSAPKATERISYGMPSFYENGNLVYFAAFERHIGFYPTPSAIEKFKKELSKYKTSKGAIQFPIDQPMPLKLIEKIVKFRVDENIKKIQMRSVPVKDLV